MYFEIESQVFPLNITEEISYFDPFHVTGQRFSDIFMGGGGVYKETSGIKWVNVVGSSQKRWLFSIERDWRESPHQLKICLFPYHMEKYITE